MALWWVNVTCAASWFENQQCTFSWNTFSVLQDSTEQEITQAGMYTHHYSDIQPPDADCIVYYCILLIVVFQLFMFTVVVHRLGSSKSALLNASFTHDFVNSKYAAT